MYQSFDIRGFRGLKEVHLAGMSRVSLITGANNVGKTAVLEAMFIHSGRNNPDLPNRIEVIRGHGQTALHPKAIWGWLFPNRRLDETIELTGVDQGGRECPLRICLAVSGKPTAASPPPDDIGTAAIDASMTLFGPVPELLMEYTDGNGKAQTSRAYIERGEIKLEAAEPRPEYACTYMSPRSRVDKPSAERFSKIDAVGGMQTIVDILRHVDKRLERLSLAFEDNQPVIKGEIGLDELVPIRTMGEGTSRLLQTILVLADSANGVVLIDELENGLHHAAMPGVWKALAYVSKLYNVQIVATTHSLECVRAAFDAFKDEKDPKNQLVVYRLSRVRKDIDVVRYDREDVAAAKEIGMDILGS